jgi:hypothetical protein
MKKHKLKKGLPEASRWRRWLKSKTCKDLLARDKRLKADPVFAYKLNELKRNHLPYKEQWKGWPRDILVYPDEWAHFCDVWHIDFENFIKGKIKSLPPVRIILTLPKGLKMELRPGYPLTEKEMSHYSLLLLNVQGDISGEPEKHCGRPRMTRRNEGLRKEYQRRRKKGEEVWNIINDMAPRERLEPITLYYIVCRNIGEFKNVDIRQAT